MTKDTFRVGAVFPSFDIEQDPIAIKDFAQAVEGMGYSHIMAYDHVLGANIASRPNWQGPYNSVHAFQEPFVLFSYLAGLTTTLEFESGIFVLPQRQTALFAKQAANLDIFCQGRLRLGVAIGWNDVEYEAMGVPFKERGARLDDQIRLLRRLWTEPTLSAETRYHKITDAGLNPLPVQRPIPIWIGGVSEAAMDRAARLGDGWMCYGYAEKAQDMVRLMREKTKKAGRDPSACAVENIIFIGERPGVGTIESVNRTPEQAAEDVALWKKAGANAVCFETLFLGYKTAAQHIDALRRIANILGLSR